jgi:uncharacterized membrane protein (DUF106 family)
MPKIAVKNRGIDDEKYVENQCESIENRLLVENVRLIIIGLICIIIYWYLSRNYYTITAYLNIEIPFLFYIFIEMVLWSSSLSIIVITIIVWIFEIQDAKKID